jgi:hypothetical protein
MPRLREKKRLREQRILGIQTGIPTYLPPELETRGFKLNFYDLADNKIGEIGSDSKKGRISDIEFELLDLGCGAFSFILDEMPEEFKYKTELLLNGNFEANDIGDPPDNWTPAGSALLTTQSGGKSRKCMRIQENGGENPRATQDVTVVPGKKYKLIGYVKKGTEATYRLRIVDKTNGMAVYDTLDKEAGDDWSLGIEKVVIAPPGCVEIRILLTQTCAAQAGTTIYFDEFSFTLGEDLPYRTRVDIHPYFDPVPWFTGFIQTIPQVGQKKPHEYSGYGFYEQLDWVLVTGSYENQDAANIVKDIIQNKVAPNTQIIYNASKVETTGYTVQSIDFDHTPAKDAVQTLADMAQGFEFGVDNSREFYFRSKDTNVNYSFWVGKHFQDIEIQENPHTVRNKLYIKMGEIQTGGSNIIGSVQDNSSISSYGLREDIIDAPEILDSADATQWANEILAKMKNPEIVAKISNVIFDKTKVKIEAKGKVRITIFDGTEYELYIEKVNYKISSAGILGQLDLRNKV